MLDLTQNININTKLVFTAFDLYSGKLEMPKSFGVVEKKPYDWQVSISKSKGKLFIFRGKKIIDFCIINLKKNDFQYKFFAIHHPQNFNDFIIAIAEETFNNLPAEMKE